MSNLIDRAQEREQLDRELALEQQRSRMRPGLTHCERPDCALPISDTRRQLGARLCLEHQTALEADARRRNARVAV